MKIDNNITSSRIKRVLSPKIIAIVFLIVALVTVVFYVTIENNDKKEILIWYVTTESEDCFSDGTLRLINDYGAQHGIDKVILSRRHPEDTYFDVAISTSAYYNCDIFIMNEEMAKKYYEMDMFLPLQESGFEGDLLYIDDKPIGVLIDEGYYLLINANLDVDLQIIYDIFEIFKR
ncbi:MAG: hypothetical protein J6S23_07840 [Clostridia bacterium]|nr:hypothetical protein [Clostridia bacterium]